MFRFLSLIIYLDFRHSSFLVNSLESTTTKDLTSRRAQIAAKIHQTYQAILPNNQQMQLVQTGQQNTR